MTAIKKSFDYEVDKDGLYKMCKILPIIPAFFIYVAMTNRTGLNLSGLFRFGVHGATVFYWTCATLSAMATMMAIIFTVLNVRAEKRVELHETFADLPRASITGGQLKIPYKQIRKVSRQALPADNEMLIIDSSIGQSRLLSSYFLSTVAFNEFIDLLAINVKIAKSNS